jgi:hypothetical protein
MAVTAEQLADEMYEMVKRDYGVKKYKSMDLPTARIKKFGDEIDKKMTKEAVRVLIDSGRCVYTYFGGSFIEIPHEEGAAKRLDKEE